MEMDEREYRAVIKAGIKPRRHRLRGFAEACSDQNSVQDLLEGLKMKKADRSDMAAWGITASEWRTAIREALESSAWHYLDDQE